MQGYAMLHASFGPRPEATDAFCKRPNPQFSLAHPSYSFHALYTIRAPYVCPFFSSVWLFHSGTLSALT